MGREANREEDMEQLHRHLETSSRPSARVMTLLSKLRSGDPLPEPSRRPEAGSYLERKQRQNDDEERNKSKEPDRERRYRSPGRDRGNDRENGRGNDRESRDDDRRERRRSRSRGRD